MPIVFPQNSAIGATYDFGGIHYIYNGDGWVNKSIYGVSAGSGISFANYNGTGPVVISIIGGATGATGATGAQGEAGQSSNYYNYKVHTTTQSPPTTNGEIRYNNATQTSSTILYVDHLDSNGDDIDIFLSLLKQNDNLIIQDASDSNNYQTWKITSAPTVILNDYTSIPVTGITSAGTGTSGFSNNHSVLFIVFSSPIATAYVESFRGLTGAVGFTNSSGIGLSVSGNTLTISNTGVLSFNGVTGAIQGVSSINGSTGAITNVAFTNAAQTFSGLQQFTQGISGSGGVTFYFSSGNTSIRFVSTAARYIEINPGSQNVMQGFGSGGFKFRANTGSLELKAPSAVIIGDTDLTNNGTQLYVDDDSAVISFVFSGGQFTFPNTDGSANYVMKTDGAGALSWSPAAFTDTAQTFSALQSFSSGISASGGITFNNNIRINSKAILGSAALNSATPGCIEFDGNVIYAGTTSGRGVVEAPHIAFASSAVSLSGVTTYQSIFTSPADVLTLAANTSYIVEGHIVIQSGSTTHTTAVRLLDFTAGVAPIFRLHFLTTGAAVGTVSRAQDTVYFETSGGILNSTSTAVRQFILLRGSIETFDSVTITPQVAFSANPGGTNQTQEGSWIKFTPIGTNTMTSVGPWA